MKYIIILLVYGMLAACHPSQQVREGNHTHMGYPGTAGSQSCLVTGVIEAIQTPAEEADGNSFCRKWKCYATVTIRQVENCGSGVIPVLPESGTIRIFFSISLSPTAQAMPEMKARFPGLKKGDRFKAYMEQRIQPGDQVIYRVDAYEKL